MQTYVLSCCSTADLTAAFLAERDISYIPFHFTLDGVSYPDDLGKSVPFADFYAAMDKGAMTATSQVSVGEYLAYFRQFLAAGKDVLHLCLSSGLSGTFQSATIAQKQLAEEFPDRKLYVIDSLCASSGYGLLMDALADLRADGKTIEEARDFAEANKLRVQHWFFSTDLKYYVRGGRISKTAGAIGGILGICPLLHMDGAGKLVPVSKVRSVKKVARAAVDQMEALATGGTEYAGKCFLSESACPDYAKLVTDEVDARFPHVSGKCKVFPIGTTIGSHTGPGTVALFFFGAPRT